MDIYDIHTRNPAISHDQQQSPPVKHELLHPDSASALQSPSPRSTSPDGPISSASQSRQGSPYTSQSHSAASFDEYLEYNVGLMHHSRSPSTMDIDQQMAAAASSSLNFGSPGINPLVYDPSVCSPADLMVQPVDDSAGEEVQSFFSSASHRGPSNLLTGNTKHISLSTNLSEYDMIGSRKRSHSGASSVQGLSELDATSDDGQYDMARSRSNSVSYGRSPTSSGTGAGTNSFVNKLYVMVSFPDDSELISWSSSGTSFIVKRIEDFLPILGQHFKHQNFSSFVRQLNMYGFSKINKTKRGEKVALEDQTWEFSHPKFMKDRPDLADEIRRKVSESSNTATSPQATEPPSSILHTIGTIPLSTQQSIPGSATISPQFSPPQLHPIKTQLQQSQQHLNQPPHLQKQQQYQQQQKLQQNSQQQQQQHNPNQHYTTQASTSSLSSPSLSTTHAYNKQLYQFSPDLIHARVTGLEDELKDSKAKIDRLTQFVRLMFEYVQSTESQKYPFQFPIDLIPQPNRTSEHLRPPIYVQPPDQPPNITYNPFGPSHPTSQLNTHHRSSSQPSMSLESSWTDVMNRLPADSSSLHDVATHAAFQGGLGISNDDEFEVQPGDSMTGDPPPKRARQDGLLVDSWGRPRSSSLNVQVGSGAGDVH